MARKNYHYTKRRTGDAEIHAGSFRSGETVETTMVTVYDGGDVEVDVDTLHVPSGRVRVVMRARYCGGEGQAQAGHYIEEMRYRHARR